MNISNFADIVIIGERIKLGWKTGKITQGSSATSTGKKFGFNSGKKKESDGQVASTTVHYPSTNYKVDVALGNQQHFQVPRSNWKNEGDQTLVSLRVKIHFREESKFNLLQFPCHTQSSFQLSFKELWLQ